MAKSALAPAASYIRNAIVGNVSLTQYLVKGDKTVVTEVDRRSQELSRQIILRQFPDVRLNQEEAESESGNDSSPIVFYHDPLDGTGGFLIGGPTPTIILGAYDSRNKNILAVATMEPVTGRFWFSAAGQGAWINRFNYNSESFDSVDGTSIKVNQGRVEGSHILVDVSHPFARKTKEGVLRQILYKQGRRELTNSIEDVGAKEASFYTNGGHYALVATGRPTIVGNITTAIGGPFDIAGLIHVIEAGGQGCCYQILEGEERKLKRLENPLDIENADLAIAANNELTLETLEEIVARGIALRR